MIKLIIYSLIAIQLDRFDLFSPKTYIIYSKSREEKERWISSIQSAQNNLSFHVQC